jgi:adenosylhomocysteine nucleosidase
MKTLVVTPLQQELDAFVASCTRLGLHMEHSTIGWLSAVRLPELNITLARGGIGKTQFAVQAQHLLDMRLNWDLAICAGAAGGLVDDVSIGDVVVATTTVEHDYNNRFSDRPLPSFEGAPNAIAGLQRAASACTLFRVHFGPVASGDEDVVDPERRRALHQKTRALAVAWEGAGGARACAFSCVPFVEIRAVTDAADHSAPADFEKNLKAAMNNVAVLITSWIWQSQQGTDA